MMIIYKLYINLSSIIKNSYEMKIFVTSIMSLASHIFKRMMNY